MYDFNSHKWMYDAVSLADFLRKVGFSEVQEKGYLESRISDIAALEQPGRVLEGAGVCVEAVRP